MIETSLHSKYNVQEGLDFLSSKDEKIANLIILNPNFSISKRCSGFKALLKTIISQQLSTSAANSIWLKFVKNELISRHKILEADQELLLSIGLSRQKYNYVKELAKQDINYHDLNLSSSEKVINRLIKIKGIGKWTAEIYCLFSLGHANIFPSGDLALQEAIRLLFDFNARPKEKEVSKISENWSPWKSLAALILWDYYGKQKKRGKSD